MSDSRKYHVQMILDDGPAREIGYFEAPTVYEAHQGFVALLRALADYYEEQAVWEESWGDFK